MICYVLLFRSLVQWEVLEESLTNFTSGFSLTLNNAVRFLTIALETTEKFWSKKATLCPRKFNTPGQGWSCVERDFHNSFIWHRCNFFSPFLSTSKTCTGINKMPYTQSIPSLSSTPHGAQRGWHYNQLRKQIIRGWGICSSLHGYTADKCRSWDLTQTYLSSFCSIIWLLRMESSNLGHSLSFAKFERFISSMWRPGSPLGSFCLPDHSPIHPPGAIFRHTQRV